MLWHPSAAFYLGGGCGVKQAAIVKSKAPPYGKRKGWVPRVAADFGSGGAFPEIFVAQYPLGMGMKEGSAKAGAILPVTIGVDGKVQYDKLLKQGQSKDKTIHSTYDSLVPVQV